jgi:glutathione peroxidase
MKTILLSILLLTGITGTGIYDFKVPGLDGNEIDFSTFRNKKILVVNTASRCGYTPQYAELQELHTRYGDQLVIIGFPANNFKGQEPGTNEEIAEFCKKNYGVSFRMAEKVSVAGDDIHPLFSYLVKEALKKGYEEPVIKWNFTKFLIDEDGDLEAVFSHKTKPLSEEVLKHLD